MKKSAETKRNSVARSDVLSTYASMEKAFGGQRFDREALAVRGFDARAAASASGARAIAPAPGVLSWRATMRQMCIVCAIRIQERYEVKLGLQMSNGARSVMP